MTLVESILLKLNQLPEEQIQKVSDFIDELDDETNLDQQPSEAIERYNHVKMAKDDQY